MKKYKHLRELIREMVKSLILDDAMFSKKEIIGDVDDQDIIIDQCPDCHGFHIPGACPLKKSDDIMDPGSAFDVGYSVAKHHDSHSSYMAKPQMFQISRESSSIYDMLDDNEKLEDWMESKIAQASRDISSIYDSLSYKKKAKKT